MPKDNTVLDFNFVQCASEVVQPEEKIHKLAIIYLPDFIIEPIR